MTKITFVNGINTVIDKVLSSKNKVYFKILDMAETKEMITIFKCGHVQFINNYFADMSE